MKTERVAWKGTAALVLAGVYAMAADTLVSALGPGRFAVVSAGVLAVMWYLADTAPHTVRYVAAPSAPVGERERMTVGEALWIAAVAIALAAVLVAVLPSLLGGRP